jgi:glycosyltransferase involved in cell wall biosynthesis
MNILIYESSSFGGCYRYALEIQKAYQRRPDVERCDLLLPKNATNLPTNTRNILVNDKPRRFKKVSFIARQFINPFVLFLVLLRQRPSLVILNDFEQTTAPLWAPFYRLFLKKHTFAVILHDPDRDAYPPSRKISAFCMKQLMSAMQLALYHQHLPAKSYYQNNLPTQYLSIPHGIYPSEWADPKLLYSLNQYKNADFLLTIPGNIRREKNYEAAIRLISQHVNYRLLVAGNTANSDVNTEEYKRLAQQLGVSERIYWIEKYLSEAELAACIEASDVVLLNYTKTFTSQSGILNNVAPFRKALVVSNTESSLAYLVKDFNLGCLCDPENQESFDLAVRNALGTKQMNTIHWDEYIAYASWDNHAEKVINMAKEI